VSDFLVGIFVALLGVVGLFLVAGAVDDEIVIFGAGLAAFAVVFDFGIVRAYYDRTEAAARGRAP
jgi:hypothetical protein